MRGFWRRPLGAVVGFLALVGVAASAAHYLREPYNPGFPEHPTIVAPHVVLGGVYLLFAPFQFTKRVRARHLGYHRRMGRALAALGLAVDTTALFMGLVIPFSGWIERGYVAVFGGLFLVALIEGYVHVRAGRLARHREWTIRAFAIGLPIATQRLIFIPALLVATDPTRGQLRALSAAAFLAAFVAHACAAEAWIRLTRKRGVPLESGAGRVGRAAPGNR